MNIAITGMIHNPVRIKRGRAPALLMMNIFKNGSSLSGVGRIDEPSPFCGGFPTPTSSYTMHAAAQKGGPGGGYMTGL